MVNISGDHLLSVIVPVYKQQRTIEKNLLQLIDVLNQIRYDYEIIVVVDGLVDKSLAKIRKIRNPNIVCLAYKENHGKSFAIRLGMKQAHGDYVMFIDSGFEIDPNGISMLLEHMQWYNADVIVGSKRHPASYVNYTWQRKILSYGYYYLVKLLFGIKVTDTQAGIKVFKKRVLVSILPKLLEKRFAGDLEMLVVAKTCGFSRIFEAPIKLNYNFSQLTTAATSKAVIGILLDTMAIFYRNQILKYYKKTRSTLKTVRDFKIYQYSGKTGKKKRWLK